MFVSRCLRSLPAALRLPLRVVPGAVHGFVGAGIFNHFLRGQAFAGRLHEIDGRCIAIEVTDARCTLCFRVVNGRLRPANDRRPDVVIRSDTAGFWSLATRREDPDTLFFQRRLCIEGDTDTGVHVKNLLDAQVFDWETHFRAVLPAPLAAPAVRLLRAVRAGLAIR